MESSVEHPDAPLARQVASMIAKKILPESFSNQDIYNGPSDRDQPKTFFIYDSDDSERVVHRAEEQNRERLQKFKKHHVKNRNFIKSLS